MADSRTTQGRYYEQTGDNLKGDQAARAYQAAQNHLEPTNTAYTQDWKRLQDKIIKALSEEV